MARHMMKAAALQSHSGGGASVPSSPLKRMANAKAEDAGAADADAEAESALQDETEAEAEAEADAELEENLRKDAMWSKFLGDDDDDDAFNASSFASEALASGSAAWCSEKLAQGMAAVEKRLRAEVIGKGKGKGKEQGQVVLLGQVGAVAQVQAAVEQLRSGVEALQGCAGRIRAEMAEPYRVIRRRTTQLANVHSAIALLQHSVRLLRLVGKLRSAMAADDAEVDLAKAAQLFNEIEELRGEGEGEAEGDVDVVEQHFPWLRDAGDRLRSLAGAALQSAMESLNQAEVASALQVFFNMGELKNTVDGMINKYRDQASKTVSWALDMKAVSTNMGPSFGPGGIQRSGMPQIGSGAKAKEGLWQRMSSCMDNLHAAMVAVWHLQRVLSKKRDPFTHVLFLDQVVQEGEPMLTDRVWVVVVKAFTNQMKSAFTTSSFVKETLVLSYPKLLSLFENLIDRISQDTNIKGVSPAIRPEGKDSLLATIEPFQTAFLAHCLSSLSNLVSNLFPVSSGGTVPSQEQISRFISRIQEEIEAVKLHAHLTLMILREIGKVLHLLAEKAEYQISTGPESRQVIGPATAAQVKNFAICLHLQEVHSRITVMVSGLPAVAMEVLSPSLGAIYGVAVDAVTPLFQAMLDRLENCILQIHEQNFGGDDLNAGMDENGSTYMEEVQKAIVHFRSEFLSKLLSPSSHLLSISGESICARLTRKMAARVLTYFVRHTSLVRPLSESGKLRLTRDMAELELVVGQNLFPVEQLGAPYRALRALKPLFFQETSKLASSPFLQDLPRSVVLHHIYSRAPDELESPMQRTKLTPKQYSLWLDSQGEEQIWKGVKATLDDYAAKVRARGDKEFSPVYPLMLQLGSPLSGPSHVSKGN